MSTLHIVNSARPDAGLEACLRLIQPGDALLLIEDGVYQRGSAPLKSLPPSVSCHVLQEDLLARGMSLPEDQASGIVDYNGFVALVCAHQRSLTWC